jgi:hypothetical protein
MKHFGHLVSISIIYSRLRQSKWYECPHLKGIDNVYILLHIVHLVLSRFSLILLLDFEDRFLSYLSMY